jgi:hypothetical protein
MEQPPNQLRKSQVDSPNKRNSGAFMYIPADIILYILDFLEYLDGANVLKQVNKHLHEIIEPEWPSISQSFFEFWPTPARPSTLQNLFKIWSNTKVKYTLKRNFYMFCMKHNKKKAINQEKTIHNYDPNNHNMNLACYLAAIMSEDSLSRYEARPSQWNVIMLKDEKCDITLNQVWTTYLTSCHNLVYLILDNVSHTHLNLKYLKNLEGLFLGYTASVDPPSSMKIFVSYTSKEKYQKHETRLLSYTRFLRLDAPKLCMELKLW